VAGVEAEEAEEAQEAMEVGGLGVLLQRPMALQILAVVEVVQGVTLLHQGVVALVLL